MSWLKLNEGLNSLKGQITNFASNVLSDDDNDTEGQPVNSYDYDQLKHLCLEQEVQIKNLKQINEELSQNKSQHEDSAESNGSWNWKVGGPNSSVPTSDLKNKISSLESERNDLLLRLEQLDTENQMNLSKVVDMRDKLQDELNDLKEDYLRVKQHNKNYTVREEKLRIELKELQQRFDQKNKDKAENEYEEKYGILAEENRKLINALDNAEKELGVLRSSNETLQKMLEDIRLDHQAENSKNVETIKVLEGENKIIYTELQRTKEQLKLSEMKREEDEDNYEKLAVSLETYQYEVSSLKREVKHLKKDKELKENEGHTKLVQEHLETGENQQEDLIKELRELVVNQQDQVEHLKKQNDEFKSENEALQCRASGRMDYELENELENIRKEHDDQLAMLQEELESLKKREEKNIAEEQKVDELHDRIRTLKTEISDMKEQNEELDANHRKILFELHNKYIKIISENIKKCQNCEKPSDLEQCSNEDDPQAAEFRKQVESIMKILLELRCKCESLEKKVIDLSEEKNDILSEKNHEIEKLLHNSEILSQEVLKKTLSIKEYENECSELAKNNDLLINDLEAYKNNSVLQTISESNEDNVILLESQLENANKRIEDLERIIDDYDRQQMDKRVVDDPDCDTSTTESEMTKKEMDHQRLLNNFDLLRIEHDSLHSDLEAARDYLQVVRDENREMKFSLEKVRSDYENTEYQLSELHVSNDSLKEELESYKKKTEFLMQENGKLKSENEENKATSDELKAKIILMDEKLLVEQQVRKDMELQVSSLTEKLKMAKMAETSLKLQYEQKSKEAVALSEAKYNLEMSLNQTNQNLGEFQNNFEELQSRNDALIKEQEELRNIILEREEQIDALEKVVTQHEEQLVRLRYKEPLINPVSKDNLDGETFERKPEKFEEIGLDKMSTSEMDEQQIVNDIKEGTDNILEQKFHELLIEKNNLQAELDKQVQLRAQLSESCAVLQQQLQEVSSSRNELVNIVTSKHQESVAYHNEIQRLTQILTIETEKVRNLENSPTKNEEIEKLTDQNNFLKEKCEIMAKNLLEEQSKVQQLISEKSANSEKELVLQKKLDRLQTHLVELEEHYTQELLQAEQKNASLQAKVTDIEEREKSSSTMYTSVSIRANQQVESLQKQLQTVTNERDSLRKQISDAEDQNNKQAAALANLQFVLEQFRKDKEKDVFKETERIRRHIVAEKQVQEDLKKDIVNLKSQLEESNQGLLAASRLSDQLEFSQKTITTLKEEVSQLQSKLSKTEEDLKNATSQTDGKVDKSLVKNLVIGFVTSNNNLNKDQLQILKIIATVLDFNQQDHDKVNLNKLQQGSWLTSFLAPHSGNPNKMSEESLSQAFVKFLENESKPRVVPSLLTSNASHSTKPTDSDSTKPRQSPIVLSEIVLPTFADFAQNRNSSSILKDVLKDSSS